MLDYIYPISYLLSATGLIMWFYTQGNRLWSMRMSKLFLGGFLIYLFSLAFSDGATPYKLLVLARDMGIMAVITVGLSRFRRNKAVFFPLLIAALAAFQWLYYPVMQQAFPYAGRPAELDEKGELLIEIREEHKVDEIQSLVESYGLSLRAAFFPEQADDTDLDDYYVVDIPDGKLDELLTIKEQLLEMEAVESLEENEEIQVDPLEAETKRDPNRDLKINDPGLTELWGFDAMEVGALYQYLRENLVKPREKALIAILDTGVDSQHEDLKDRYRSTKEGYDNDPRGHGTHCAGIAAAVTNNGKGIASFALTNDYVELTSIKVLSAGGSGTQRTIINGILEAADRGADVISMSLGGYSRDKKQRAYSKAITYANKAGAIVVCAAGNNGGNARNIAPANVPGVITVSAINSDLNKAEFSNYIQDLKMAVAAPGVNIYSTIPGDKYATFNGTSMATPYVSGLVGLMKSLKPALTTEDVYRILEKTGKKTNDTRQTGKLIVPVNAVKEVL
jgi:thermitase